MVTVGTWVIVKGHKNLGARRVVRIMPLTGMLELERKVYGLLFWSPEEVEVNE